MIFAGALSAEEYSLPTNSGYNVGLYDSYYFQNKELFSLLLIGTFFGFEYEIPKPNRDKITVSVKDVEVYESTLEEEIDEVQVKEHLTTKNPVDFYHLIKNRDLNHLPLVSKYYSDVTRFDTVVASRAGAWAMHNPQARVKKGNVIHASFGTKPVIQGVDEDIVYLYGEVKAAMEELWAI